MPVSEDLESAVSVREPVASPPDAGSGSARPSGVSRRLIQLDFTRGIAILMVMGYHFTSIPTHVPLFRAIEFPLKHFGWAGVDLFFVLSGFLVGGLLIGELFRTGSLRIGRFIKRRGFKIWPAYYAYLLFQLITRHFPPSTFLAANLLHLQNYLGTSLGHTWTLAVEEHFYLLLPLLLVWLHSSPWLRGKTIPLLAFICVAVLCIRSFMVLGLGSTRVWEYTHTRLDSLMFGVLLSYLYYFRRNAFDALCRKRFILGFLTVCGILFLSFVSETSTTMHTIGYTINYLCCGAFMLLMLSIKGPIASSFGYRAVATIGVYSYSIYLWHLSVRTPISHLCALLPMPGSIRWITLFLAQYGGAIILGFVMAKLIEWPFLQLREKLLPA
jgi:peptidoglycan/LPS O-acetylase OafA/YrhL